MSRDDECVRLLCLLKGHPLVQVAFVSGRLRVGRNEGAYRMFRAVLPGESIMTRRERLEAIENMERSVVEEFKEALDECLPEVEIGTLRYLPSRVLEAIDPVAFRESYWDHFNEEIGELSDLGEGELDEEF
jgi:hypothetical protein